MEEIFQNLQTNSLKFEKNLYSQGQQVGDGE